MPLPAFNNNIFLGISFDPDSSPSIKSSVLEKLADWNFWDGDSWAIASKLTGFTASDDSLTVVTSSTLFDRSGQSMQDADGLLNALRSKRHVAARDFGPPFRYLWASHIDSVLHAVTDDFGLHHMFYAAGDGYALISSSCSLLADVVGAKPNVEALAAFALFGAFPENMTAYQKVTRLSAGTRLELKDGTVALFPQDPAEARDISLEASFKGAVAARLKADPCAALELSGGLDSRIVLAAIPPSERGHRKSFTLRPKGQQSADADVAHKLAQLCELDHEIVEIDFHQLNDAAHYAALLDKVIDGYDHMANPFDKLPLLIADTGRFGNSSFGGQNGEILRGFYYPGQDLESVPNATTAARLVDWRVASNDRANDRLFNERGKKALTDARQRMTHYLLSFSGNWGQVLDQFYLAYRMQCWAGNAASNRFIARNIFWPFFDRDFVRAAMREPSGKKNMSVAAYRLLENCDKRLSKLKLAEGLSPHQILKGGIGARLALMTKYLVNGLRKARQKLSPAAKSTLGSSGLIMLWHELELYRSLDIEKLCQLGIFNESALETVKSGQWVPDRASLGFLLLCNRIVTKC